MLRNILTFSLAAAFLGFPKPAAAQLYELSFGEIIRQSVLVAEGRVVAQESFWDQRGQSIFTSNTVEITGFFKGAAPALIQVITPGGIVGDRMELVSESVQYAVGDAGLFCLIQAAAELPLAPAWENFGSPHGFFRYDLATNRAEHPFHPANSIAALREQVQKQTREPLLQVPGKELQPLASGRAAPAITSFTPSSLSAGTGALLTVSGSGFGAGTGTVQFINSNTGSNFTIDANDIISWADNQVVVRVPSTAASPGGCAGTGFFRITHVDNSFAVSPTALTVEFGYTNFISGGIKYGAKLVDDNGDGGLTFTLSTNLCGGGTQDATNAIGRALREWRCVSGVNWEISTATTTTNTTGSDGINIITFDVGTGLPMGVLGRATSYYTSCSSGGTLYWRVSEVDLNLDQGTTWYYCDDPAGIPFSSYDFQSVIFHELGHGHQLQHIVNSAAVMHRSIANGQIKRTLNANEENGADYVLALAANPCGPDPMTLLSSPGCQTVALPAACNGAGPCTASLPVELMFFRGAAQTEGIWLEWATASEWSNDFFTLERSTDAVRFEELVRMPGEPHSVQLKKYGWLDRQPVSGLNYYRLRQRDLDGSETLLGMIGIPFSAEENTIQVYPNPLTGGTLFLRLENLQISGPLDLTLTDLSGRLLHRKTLELPAASTLPVPLEDLRAGSYRLFVHDPGRRRLLLQTLIVKPQ